MKLFVVGAGLFGSLAAAHARSQGIEAVIFDPALPGAASPAAAGLFKKAWAGRRWAEHYDCAIPLLDHLFGIRNISLTDKDGKVEAFQFVPPSAILEPNPVRQAVTAVGDGWLEAAGQRHEGWVYIAAGVWCEPFVPGLQIVGKAGAAYVFTGEHAGRIQPIAHGRQALAFTRDPGSTYFSDGTAELDYGDQHDQATLQRAASFGLTDPIRRIWGRRPYTPGGPLFQQLGDRTWLGTGGRKMGTIVGASFASRLIEEVKGKK